MSRDKQILGMARVIYENTAISCVKTADEIAVELYEKGYRKASEVAREIFEEIATILRHYDMLAERDKSEYGELIVMDIGCAIAELKKKYIGEDTNVLTNTEEEK